MTPLASWPRNRSMREPIRQEDLTVSHLALAIGTTVMTTLYISEPLTIASILPGLISRWQTEPFLT